MTNAEAVNWLINITADIGKIEHQDLWHYEQALSEIREMLEDAPQRMRGKWIGGELGRCSVCGHEGSASDIWNGCKGMFCPNCGADMRGTE